MYYFLFFFLVLMVFSIFLILKFSRKKRLKKESKLKLESHFYEIKKLSSSKERITDFDKLYHKILRELRYSWTFWEILKSKPKIIDDIEELWELHKLRNKLVHDFSSISEKTLEEKALRYEKLVYDFLDKL